MFWDEKIHYVAVLYALAGNQTARFCSVRRTARIGRNDEKAARAGWKLSAEAHQKRGGICENDNRQVGHGVMHHTALDCRSARECSRLTHCKGSPVVSA